MIFSTALKLAVATAHGVNGQVDIIDATTESSHEHAHIRGAATKTADNSVSRASDLHNQMLSSMKYSDTRFCFE